MALNPAILARANDTLTVAELIEKLQALPSDAKVWADGCDCTNPVSDAVLDNDYVLLEVKL